ncbi:hypothetical protein COLO4_20569 [Corchorus olitorius]|uniref:Uncharacterized protein n=1 Tax=Corchorus olitorius TaxID=93759 RepID=A0A1R3IZ03_9ROSI|nr:hypothetical protein COLO4_20569 [Corchorus olitorius]
MAMQNQEVAGNAKPNRFQSKEIPEVFSLYPHIAKEDMTWIDHSIVATLKSFIDHRSVQDTCDREGITYYVRPMGGCLVLLTFEDKEYTHEDIARILISAKRSVNIPARLAISHNKNCFEIPITVEAARDFIGFIFDKRISNVGISQVGERCSISSDSSIPPFIDEEEHCMFDPVRDVVSPNLDLELIDGATHVFESSFVNYKDGGEVGLDVSPSKMKMVARFGWPLRVT